MTLNSDRTAMRPWPVQRCVIGVKASAPVAARPTMMVAILTNMVLRCVRRQLRASSDSEGQGVTSGYEICVRNVSRKVLLKWRGRSRQKVRWDIR